MTCPSCERINAMLQRALSDAGKILQGAGASPTEMLNATLAFVPLMKLLKESVREGTPPAQSAPGDLEGSPLIGAPFGNGGGQGSWPVPTSPTERRPFTEEQIEQQITDLPCAKILPLVRR